MVEAIFLAGASTMHSLHFHTQDCDVLLFFFEFNLDLCCVVEKIFCSRGSRISFSGSWW